MNKDQINMTRNLPSFIFLFAMCFSTLYANEKSDLHLSYVIGGSLSSSENFKEEFVIDFNQDLIWKTSGTYGGFDPGGCQNQAGQFKAKISKTEHLKVSLAAKAAIKSIQLPQGPALPSRGVSKKLKVLIDEDSYSGNLQHNQDSTQEWKKFEELVEILKKKIFPEHLLTITSKRLKNSVIQLKFHYYGKKPFPLLIPLDPNLSFFIQGYQMEYEKKRITELEYLSPSRKAFALNLKLKPIAEKVDVTKITYSNKMAMHHAEMDFTKGLIRPIELNICSSIK
jgi:hypothetical protein